MAEQKVVGTVSIFLEDKNGRRVEARDETINSGGYRVMGIIEQTSELPEGNITHLLLVAIVMFKATTDQVLATAVFRGVGEIKGNSTIEMGNVFISGLLGEISLQTFYNGGDAKSQDYLIDQLDSQKLKIVHY
jgi:hypothetical protein